MEMTPRQRWLAILQRKQPDRVPTDFWSTPEVLSRLKHELNCADDESLWQRLHIDKPRTVGPTCNLKHHPHDPQADLWGVRYSHVNYGAGAYDEAVHHPLANMQTVSEIDAFRWPSADDYDYAPITESLAKDDGRRAIQAASFEPFLIYCSLRGMEQSYEDLLLNPHIADAILGHIFEFYYEHNRRIFHAGPGKIDITYVAEDLGSQTGPLMSMQTFRRFLLPNQKKMADLARSFGIHVFYHTDGASRAFIPDLIDVVGIEVLNPIQWRCSGMELQGLVRDFGDRIAFHGAIDNQRTLPFGTVNDVRQLVEECARIFKGYRWICAPCHNIQPITPTANILAMYETIHQIGSI